MENVEIYDFLEPQYRQRFE